MHPALLIAIIVPAPFLLFVLHWVAYDMPWRKVRRDTADRVAKLLSCDPPSKLRDFTLKGQCNEVPVTFHAVREFRFTTYYTQWRTKIDVLAPLEHVRMEISQKMWNRGDVAGIQLGDEEFDKKYLVEGVPKEIIKDAVTADVRMHFLKIPGGGLTVNSEGIFFRMGDWSLTSAEAEATVCGLSLLATGLISGRDVNLSKMTEVGGAVRSQPDFKEAERIEASRRGEVKGWDAHQMKKEKALSTVLRVASVLIVLLALSFVIALYAGLS